MEKRFLKGSGVDVFNGNELIIKGGLEAKINEITGYPGSPVAETFDVISNNKEIFKENGILVQIANNEALGAARLHGSQMADIKAMTIMKSVGMNVAADALLKGGALAIVGDDPWSLSTQVPADSRMMSKHLYMPIMEPSTFQELKDWVKIGFDLSKKSKLFISYLVTTNQADGGGTVSLFPNEYPEISLKNKITLDSSTITSDNAILPPHTQINEVDILKERFPKLLEEARKYSLNKILYKRRSRIGFISSGLAYSYLEHALNELGLSGKIPILKLGITYPIDQDIIKEFADMAYDIYVVEEKRDFIESQVSRIIKDLHQSHEIDFVNVWGKKFPRGLNGIPEVLGLNPSIIIEKIAPVLMDSHDKEIIGKKDKIMEEISLLMKVKSYDVSASPRKPTFCSGCPHRDSASNLKELTELLMNPVYMKERGRNFLVDLIFHGDTGCYTMLKYEPFSRLMQNYAGMTLGGGTGAGIDPFIKSNIKEKSLEKRIKDGLEVVNKQVVFMGDSTFYHGGRNAISDALKNNQDITFIILDNKTTAMTGHQPTPGNASDILDNQTFAQDIENEIGGMIDGVKEYKDILLIRTNPADRKTYRKILENALLQEGDKVIVADKECGITYHRRLKRERDAAIEKEGFLKLEEHINITPEVCENCRECTNSTGCPGLTIIDTDYGKKIGIDFSSCVTDTACTKIKACPAFEKIVIKRKNKPKNNSKEINLENIIEPGFKELQDKWYCYIDGIGGMGTGVVSTILSRAGMLEGYKVLFNNRRGLAIRNGGVYAQVVFTKSDDIISPVIPYGKANLLLGLDIIETLRSIEPKQNMCVASKERTSAIINNAQTPTMNMLMGFEEQNIQDLESKIREHTKSNDYFSANLFNISERYLGNKIYTNLIMLGVAFQKGLLPLKLKNLEESIKLTLGDKDYEENIKAFKIGRKLVTKPEEFNIEKKIETYEDALNDKSGILSQKDPWLANSYRINVENIVGIMKLDDKTNKDLALRVYDLIQYEDFGYAAKYMGKVIGVFEKDSKEKNYEATKAVIWNLHKVMAIKDEIYVAHLLTSEEKLKKDKIKYNVDEANGDEIEYVHINRPHINIFGFDAQFDHNTRNWELNLLKKMKFLRKKGTFGIFNHVKEEEFRDWYSNEVIGFFLKDSKERYEDCTRALKIPYELPGSKAPGVTGYREVIYPKYEKAHEFFNNIRKS
ncbi:2-oxoacid:acceptor oxidoreductase family protein [Candidatus Woesearchaeota archaeon]|nr:2-oxoacid:acceptor oxidoreductase family protein [Candidatus Woesearchaeota archaeon]